MSKQAVHKFILILKKWQLPLEKFVFPVVLLLWPLAAAGQGICLSDPAYSLANYAYLTPEYPWFFATYLANGLGRLLLRVSGGGLFSMNVLTGLVVSLAALACYYILQRMIPGWMVFIGEMLAISLCWCPTVILYNYLSYFLLTLGCLFLFLAVSGRRSDLYYILAGLCLGANVTVRIANAVQVLLILAVWFYYAVRTGGKAAGAENRKACLRATGLCILGYAAGFLIPVLCSMVFHGAGAYFAAIPGILSMTSGSAGYGMGAMLKDILSAYVSAGKWFALMLCGTFAGMIFFRLPAVRRFRVPALVLYLMGIAVMIRFFYGRGMFTVNYQDYWCMFSWGMQFLLLSWLAALPGLLGARLCAEERFLCALSLLLMLILPLGSNNYTFPVLNCLFVTAPVTLWLLRRYTVMLLARERGACGQAGACLACAVMTTAILAMVFVQGALFHMNFAFRDGTDGTRRSAVITTNARMAGMHTTPENAAIIEALLDTVTQNTEKGSTAICFGNLPGVHYFAQIPPALETAWPDLDSYPVDWMESRLQSISEGTRPLPLVIISTGETGYANDAKKRELLSDFMAAHHYETIYEGQGLLIRRAPSFQK